MKISKAAHLIKLYNTPPDDSRKPTALLVNSIQQTNPLQYEVSCRYVRLLATYALKKCTSSFFTSLCFITGNTQPGPQLAYVDAGFKRGIECLLG